MGIRRSDIEQEVYSDSWAGRVALAGDAVCGQSVMASGRVAESAFAAVTATGLEPNQRGNFSLGT